MKNRGSRRVVVREKYGGSWGLRPPSRSDGLDGGGKSTLHSFILIGPDGRDRQVPGRKNWPGFEGALLLFFVIVIVAADRDNGSPLSASVQAVAWKSCHKLSVVGSPFAVVTEHLSEPAPSPSAAAASRRCQAAAASFQPGLLLRLNWQGFLQRDDGYSYAHFAMMGPPNKARKRRH